YLGCPFEVRDDVLIIQGSIKSLPLVEGEYYLGLYVESREIREDFAYISRITVIGKQAWQGALPYPSNVRGVIELDYEAEAIMPGDGGLEERRLSYCGVETPLPSIAYRRSSPTAE